MTKHADEFLMRRLFLKRSALTPWGSTVDHGVPEKARNLEDITPKLSTQNPSRTLQDFITLLKPKVMSLVVFTAFVGMSLKGSFLLFQPFLKSLSLLAIALGSGGAGAINMWYDQDIDRLMSRTQGRPIPQERVAPDHALAFGLVLSVFSVLLMALSANFMAAGLLAFSIFFYTVVYTMWLKRRTPQNIVIGGAAGAFPPVIGWVSAGGSFWSLEPWILFLIIFLWTPPHFWALALNRSEDYEKANVPMMPNVVGSRKTREHILFYSALLVLSSHLLWVFSFQGWFYGAVTFILGGIFLGFSVEIFRKPQRRACTNLFLFSILYLFLLFMAMLIN